MNLKFLASGDRIRQNLPVGKFQHTAGRDPPSQPRYLERQFGEAYTKYKARVPRWL